MGPQKVSSVEGTDIRLVLPEKAPNQQSGIACNINLVLTPR